MSSENNHTPVHESNGEDFRSFPHGTTSPTHSPSPLASLFEGSNHACSRDLPPIYRPTSPEWLPPIGYLLGTAPLISTHFVESPEELESYAFGSGLFGPSTTVSSDGPLIELNNSFPLALLSPILVFVGLQVEEIKLKRPRRRYHEIVRGFSCNYLGCSKAYGALSHLNNHIVKIHRGSRLRARDYHSRARPRPQSATPNPNSPPISVKSSPSSVFP